MLPEKKKKVSIKKRFTKAEMQIVWKDIHEQYIAGKSRTEIIEHLANRYGLKIRTAESQIEKCWANVILPLYERDYVILLNKNIKRYEYICEQLSKYRSRWISNPKSPKDYATNKVVEKEMKDYLRALKQKARLTGEYQKHEVTIINNDIKLVYHTQEPSKKNEFNLELMEVEDLAKMLAILEKTKVDKQLSNLEAGNIIDIGFEEIK